MTDSFPMAIHLQIDPVTNVITVTLQNQGVNTFALRHIFSFGTRPRVDPLWLEINAPVNPERAPGTPGTQPLPAGPAERDLGVRLVKPGETAFLGTMDLSERFILKPKETYTVRVFYQDTRKLRPDETLSAFWTVSDMHEPVISPPLTIQLP
jgi:hypothetical protein